MAVETVELIPLGLPELGMTRAEMMEIIAHNTEMAHGMGDTFYTLLFAYIIAMFIAGRLLTRTQYVIANIMYVVVMTLTVFGLFNFSRQANAWVEYAGMHNGFGDFTLVVSALFAILVILSIWFGRKVRHPTSELPQ
ncbi:MAG: hypothetical protein ABJ056_05755 [Halioglobus sp.]